jgi:hypothetical protein
MGGGVNVEEFWAPWEAEASSFDEVSDLIYGLFDKWSKKGRVFAWRGQTDASWPLHSSLYRRLCWSSSSPFSPQEVDMAQAERRILADLHRWGLHMGEYGRLSVMGQLAVLQHYGAPTRLIDVTFNPWIGLWFAVEDKPADDGVTADVDVRLFAIDVTDRLINERDESHRVWEDNLHFPWPNPTGPKASPKDRRMYRAWITDVLAWRPPHFHPRIAAQNGGFLLGGVPATGAVVWPRSTISGDGVWPIDDVRRATSVPLRVHKLGAEAGGPSADAMFTIRIKARAVAETRKRLQELCGYQHSTIYPDYIGFAAFGTPQLRAAPPTGLPFGSQLPLTLSVS